MVSDQRGDESHEAAFGGGLDVLADQTNVLAESLTVDLDQDLAMPRFFCLHLLEHLRRSGIGSAEPAAKSA